MATIRRKMGHSEIASGQVRPGYTTVFCPSAVLLSRLYNPTFAAAFFQEERTLADVLAQGGQGAVAGLGHDGAFGHAGSGRDGGEAGAEGVARVVAGDASFRNQLLDHQGGLNLAKGDIPAKQG